MQTISLNHDFALPVDRVYAYLSEHENLGPLFGAKITRVCDGTDSRNGAGSIRSLKVGPMPAFQETVIEAKPNALIRYRITQGGVLKDHEGIMTFSSNGTGSHLLYTIQFNAPPVLAQIVKAGLERNISKGLATVDAKA